MGTNFYARVLPTKEQEQELIDAILNKEFDKIKELTQELYGSYGRYDDTGTVYHLGKRSSGWSFLWNHNVHFYYDKNYNWCPKYIYSLNKQGITDFVNRDDVIIFNEYKDVLDKKEFLDMAFTWIGINNKEYYTNPKYDSGYYYSENQSTLNQLAAIGVKTEYGEFYSDGLRFSTSIEFC